MRTLVDTIFNASCHTNSVSNSDAASQIAALPLLLMETEQFFVRHVQHSCTLGTLRVDGLPLPASYRPVVCLRQYRIAY